MPVTIHKRREVAEHLAFKYNTKEAYFNDDGILCTVSRITCGGVQSLHNQATSFSLVRTKLGDAEKRND